jgi:pimeloyl-ACP methyl ester carboxylesterase
MKRHVLVALVVAVTLASCTGTATFGPPVIETFKGERARTQEVSFRSKGFKLVGDLRLPADGELHPAIIMVHGSGGATRDGAVYFEPLIEIFLRNGYAVFSWDKPGSGASKGDFDGRHLLSERAAILADAVQVLVEHPEIDPARVGLWGISQAGWVMPLALELAGDIAFMIVVGGGAEDSIEQMAFQVGQRVICTGGSDERAALVEKNWSQFKKATNYSEYREAVESLLEIPEVKEHTGLQLAEEKRWKPLSRDSGSFFDPMEVIEHTTIPVLALYGELDKNIDPVQGAEAYKAALERAGNQDSQVVVIPGAGHVLVPARTGCLGEGGGRQYVPEYLEILDAWLQQLSR